AQTFVSPVVRGATIGRLAGAFNDRVANHPRYYAYDARFYSCRASLRGVQSLADVAVAHQAAGHGAGMLAALVDRRAGDDGRLVAVDFLHEAAAVGRHVVNEFRLLHLQAPVVDQIDIGAQPRRQPAAVVEPEEVGGLAGL